MGRINAVIYNKRYKQKELLHFLFMLILGFCVGELFWCNHWLSSGSSLQWLHQVTFSFSIIKRQYGQRSWWSWWTLMQSTQKELCLTTHKVTPYHSVTLLVINWPGSTQKGYTMTLQSSTLVIIPLRLSCVCVYIYIYIYINRERRRGREKLFKKLNLVWYKNRSKDDSMRIKLSNQS